MLNHILHEGFASAHRRMGLVLCDIFWKALWLFITVVLFGLSLTWIGLQVQSSVLDGASSFSTNPLLALTLARQFWAAYAADLLWGGTILVAISAIVWVLLEAYFRSGLLAATNGTFTAKVSANFRVFLASSVARTVILLTAVLLIAVISFWPYLTTPLAQWALLWESTRGVAVIGIVILMALSFLLTVADTLIRSDAVRLFGTHMFEVTSLIGTLLLFELFIAVSAGIAVLVGMLYVSTPMELLFVLAGGSLAGLLVSTMHSYLLLVRFLSIGIMKRHVGEV